MAEKFVPIKTTTVFFCISKTESKKPRKLLSKSKSWPPMFCTVCLCNEHVCLYSPSFNPLPCMCHTNNVFGTVLHDYSGEKQPWRSFSTSKISPAIFLEELNCSQGKSLEDILTYVKVKLWSPSHALYRQCKASSIHYRQGTISVVTLSLSLYITRRRSVENVV